MYMQKKKKLIIIQIKINAGIFQICIFKEQKTPKTKTSTNMNARSTRYLMSQILRLRRPIRFQKTRVPNVWWTVN